MKLVKMSLAAALLVSGAYALDNVKVNGSAKLIYQTTDVDNKANSSFGATQDSLGGAQVLLGATADLVDNISAGAEAQVFSTLGLENNMVDGVMATGSTNDAWNMAQLWMAASYGKTTAKVGRMELDTPLAFTEKWNVAKNTFESAVLINTDLPDTTLVAAYVGKHNGMGVLSNSGQTAALEGTTTVTDNNGTANVTRTIADGGSSPFSSFYGGAYAFAAVYSGLENTTLQAWYYDVNDLAEAIWLQADVKLIDMVNVGVQYASISPELSALTTGTLGMDTTTQDLDAWAAKVSGTVSDINLFVAYSDVDKATNNPLAMANTATQDKTKLYTGTNSIYMDGRAVGFADTQSWKIGASTAVSDFALAANYTAADQGNNGVAGGETKDYTGFDFSVGTKVGAIALKAIYADYDVDSSIAANDTGRNTIRVIASVKF
jgi:hypothetical protein